MSEQKEKWQGWLALSTAIMAVLAALTTLYMGKYSSRAIMSQGQESDQWAYYQAKSIKEHAYEISRRQLELRLQEREGASGQASDAYRATIDRYGREIQRYEKERGEIKARAEELAKRKLTAQEMGGDFGYALIFLQIALMLSSISSLTTRRYLWYLAMASTIGWLFFFVDAWLLFY
jgi:hypothetical protein